jgi:formyltetrahydrofolate hydrolase
MTSHYVSQENDPGYAIDQLAAAVRYAQKFAAIRYYGDSVALAEAALAVECLSNELTRLSKEVIALHELRQVAAE